MSNGESWIHLVLEVEEVFMKMNLYVVFDRVAEECGPVFSAVNDGVASRQYRNLLREVPPSETDAFKLYKIADFDSGSMRLVVDVDPVEIVLPPDIRDDLKQHKLAFVGPER